MKRRIAWLGGLAVAAATGILLLRPGALPAPLEADVMASLARQMLTPMGDVVAVSEPSDCRSGGIAKASLPAALFGRFVDANGALAQAFDLAGIGSVKLPPPEHASLPPALLAGAIGRPVVAISRVGMLEQEALVCVEVFAKHDRAFFVVLTRGHGRPWSVARELPIWEGEPPPRVPAGDDEPLFSPRPSQLDRAAT